MAQLIKCDKNNNVVLIKIELTLLSSLRRVSTVFIFNITLTAKQGYFEPSLIKLFY